MTQALYHTMSYNSEEELLIKIRKDPEKFSELYDLYFDKILNYVFHRTSDFDLARDITAEVFIKVYLKIWTFRWRKISIGAWIYRIATNEVNQYFRKRKYHAQNLMEWQMNSILQFESIESEKEDAMKEVQAHSDYNKVQRILTGMEIKFQEVIALRYFDKKSIREISEIVNKKEGTVKSLISRGLEKIRNRF